MGINKEIDFFNRIAPEWDGMEVRSLPAKVVYILDKVCVRSGQRVLDVGCGTGVLIPYLLNMVGENGFVKGVDFSEGMLKEARRKYQHLVDYELFEQLNIEEDNVGGRYDIIVMYCVYPHLIRPYECIRKLIKENLENNGRIIIAFPNDEEFVNSIHKDKKVDSDLLPDAVTLSAILKGEGFRSRVIEYNKECYIVEVVNK